ncbi:MAG: hypothetical protein JNK82_36440 [Myxococcaceae bacterium]|nr:hypothetical protein [Myxococcaceae bacterium]
MRRPALVTVLFFLYACGQTPSCGGCAGMGPIPGGAYTGTRTDTAAAARLSKTGFDVLNANASVLVDLIAPGGNMVVPLKCDRQAASILGDLMIADEGTLGCTSESCGQLDGRCEPRDVPKQISIHFNTFSLHPKGPNQLEARANITLTTNGKIMISSPSNHLLCLFGDQIKLSVDLNTARAQPPSLQIAAGIRFTVDTRWWRLLSMEVASLDGTKACGTSGAAPLPACIDGDDLIIAAENGCSNWISDVANVGAIKDALLTQLTGSLQDQIEEALQGANCRACDGMGMCPTNGAVTSVCRASDAGTPDGGNETECWDNGGMRCVPAVLGLENRIDIAQVLGAGSPLDVSIAAGGSVESSDAGISIGFLGGARAVQTAACVKPVTEPTLPALPLPDFDTEAPGPYDVGLSLSNQMMRRLLLHAQQSGALCIEIGTESVTLLDSSLVGTLLPSLNKLTGGKTVPMRVVVRPNNPPTADFGSGKNGEPLITLDWNDAQVDVYALLDDRYARLFSVTFDAHIPLSLAIEGCSTVTPVIGSLTGTIVDVHAIDSDILAEPLSAVEALVPSLITFAEPALAGGLTGFTLPEFGDFQVKLLSAQGVGQISGTRAYNHLGVFAQLLPATQPCMAMMMKVAEVREATLGKNGGARLDVTSRDQEYSWRMPGGVWSEWVKPSPIGKLDIVHPRLSLDGRQVIELRTRDALHSPSPVTTVELTR